MTGALTTPTIVRGVSELKRDLELVGLWDFRDRFTISSAVTVDAYRASVLAWQSSARQKTICIFTEVKDKLRRVETRVARHSWHIGSRFAHRWVNVQDV